MALTVAEEAGLRAMLAEWIASKDVQAQGMLDGKATAEGQLTGIKPYVSDAMKTKIDAALELPK